MFRKLVMVIEECMVIRGVEEFVQDGEIEEKG